MPPRDGVRGRPSRNCGNCRAVKRRCDQQVPHCGQCIRLREKCTGYRDEWALVFRNQTDHTIKRSEEKRAKNTTLAQANNLPLAGTLSPNIDQIGVNYFLRHFVVGDQSTSRGYLNYIPTVCRGDGEHPTLVASMAAVGLLALANSTRQPGLAVQARAKYSEAIRNVNDALESPAERVKDSTVMSVISLSVYEHVCDYESWIRHVQGAAALLVARGKGQFSSPVQIRIFNQVRADLVLACLHSTRPFPEDMLALQADAAEHADTSSSFWLLGVLGARCANLLMGIRNTTEEVHWPGFLQDVIAVERDLQNAMDFLFLEEPFTITLEPGGDPRIICKGRLDLYKDPWSIRVWNNSRSLHMIVCEILCFLLNKVLVADVAETVRNDMRLRLQQTLQKLSNLGDDILASVPQSVEFVPAVSKSNISVDPPFHSSMSGGYMLIWSLYMVGKCVVTNRETRQWIIGFLQNIGRNMGISIALKLVEDIKRIDEWAG